MVKTLSLDHTARQALESGSSKRDRRDLRVLIVEDEALVGWSLANILQRMHISSVVAESAEEAFELFTESLFDLIITDRQLPNMKGEELAGLVKQISPLVPVILISALEFPEELKDSPSIDYFVEKPFNLNEMSALILGCLSADPDPPNAP